MFLTLMPDTRRSARNENLPRRRRRGLTLVEIVVVVAMMLIVASIAYPIYMASIKYAHRSACASNLQEVAQAVTLSRMEGSEFPAPPGAVGDDGIPLGGVTGLAHIEKYRNGEYSWCKEDTYPQAFPRNLWAEPAAQCVSGLLRDYSASSYDYGYNYYGLVTTTTGMPYAVTTLAAAQYLFGDPLAVDTTLLDDIFPGLDKEDFAQELDWDLRVLDTATVTRPGGTTRYARPRGSFQGLLNSRAPQHTLITFCPHHIDAEGKGIIPAVLLNGTAVIYKPVQPLIVPNANMVWSGPSPRKDGADGRVAPIDWRINKAAFGSAIAQTGKLFGDSPRNMLARDMPVVQVIQRRFTAAEASPWYDTGIPVQPHDLIMVIARAKWRPTGFASSADAYKPLLDEYAQLWFTADGDPVDRPSSAGAVRGLLVGSVGGGPIIPLGARGSAIVPSGSNGNLLLTMNDPGNLGDFTGWCEAWIALYRPSLPNYAR